MYTAAGLYPTSNEKYADITSRPSLDFFFFNFSVRNLNMLEILIR